MLRAKSISPVLKLGIAFAVMSLLLSGCSSLGISEIPWISGKKKEIKPQSSQTTMELAKLLQQRRKDIKTVAVKGGAHVVTPTENLYGDHVIIAQAPGQLRAEVFGPFGQPALVVVCNGVFLTIMDYQNNQAYKGAASTKNLSQFLGLELTPLEIFNTLIGIPALQDGNELRSEINPDGLIHVTGQAPGRNGMLNLILEPDANLVQRAWLSADADKQDWEDADMRVVYREYSSQEEPPRIPLQLEFEDKEGRALELLHNEVRINPELPEDIFELKILPAIPIIPLH
jgi:outer membrane lipoprotein-sorting protein